MGTLEQRARSDKRWGAFQAAMLAAVAFGGVVLIAATAPNAAQLLRYFPGYKRGARFNFRAKSALSRLAEKDLVIFTDKDGKRYARITEKGRQALAIETERVNAGKKRRWDRRWRIVAFDISEKRKSVRVRLRRFMHSCGFERLQDSVWVFPYDCEDLIALVKAEFKIGAEVLYLIVEQLERDQRLRELFHLPPSD